MKCPVCQAILLPVDGDMFCLQCGRAQNGSSDDGGDVLKLEDTTDPVLKRALWDATDGIIEFKDAVPVLQSVAKPVEKKPEAAPLRYSSRVVHNEGSSKKSGHKFKSLHSWAIRPRPVAVNGWISMLQLAPLSHNSQVRPTAIAGVSPGSYAASSGVSMAAKLIEKGMLKAWTIGLAGLALFLGINFAIGTYYADRVYPGVHIGSLAVGGLTFDELHRRLPMALDKPSLAAMVDSRQYQLDLNGVGSVNVADVERTARESGRSSALPLAAVIGSWYAKPVAPAFTLNDRAVDRAVQELAAAVKRTASNASMVINGTDVFILADKSGVSLDENAAAAAIRAAYGHAATASIATLHPKADVAASDYTNDASLAQATITTAVQLLIKKAHYSPTPGQIASWLVLNGSGRGVSVDKAGIAVFVATIPGSFDRVAAVNGIAAALEARRAAIVSPSTKKPTADPKLASIAKAGPVTNYNYCVDKASGKSPELPAKLGTVLGSAGSWTLGGKISFAFVKTDCNLTFKVANVSEMAMLDQACEHQTTCRLHNELYISRDSWTKVPSSWAGNLDTYRTELINHVVGQWLGFEHPSCAAATTQTPVITTPSIEIGGCSAKWYAVPAELQDTKVLPGF